MASIAMFIYWEIWLSSWYIHIKVLVGGEITIYHCYIMLYYVPIKVKFISVHQVIQRPRRCVLAPTPLFQLSQSQQERSVQVVPAFHKWGLPQYKWWVCYPIYGEFLLMENPNVKWMICWKIAPFQGQLHLISGWLHWKAGFVMGISHQSPWMISWENHGKTDWLSQLRHYIPIFIPKIYPQYLLVN